MSGGVVQLVAVGPQDTWLTGKPEVSFYRSNYKRYTHFSNSIERQIIQGQPVAGGISTIRFEKKGDLLSYVYLTALDSNGSQLVNPDWTRIIDKVELLIGGQVIDTQDIEYMTDIEPITGAQTFSQRYLNNNNTTFNNQKNSVLPLKFFFCKDWSVALPLIGLQFHDVEVRITWSPYLTQTISNLLISSSTNPSITSTTIPNSTANAFSVGLASNTFANIFITEQTGPIFPGMLMTPQFSSPSFNMTTNAAVVQYFSNISAYAYGSSNIAVAYSNVANVYSYASNVVSLFNPSVSAQVVGPNNTIGSAGTVQLTLNQIVNTSGSSNITPGMYVYGLPVPSGAVTVSSWSPPTVTLSLTTYPTATVTVPLNTTIAFLSNASTTTSSSATYSSLQFQAWTNFIYLDQNERDYFAKVPQNDLLVTQVQRAVLGTNPIQELAFAQPIKFLAWPSVNYQQIYNSGLGSATATPYQLKTQVNGVDVGDSRSLIHWTEVPQYYNTPYGYVHNNQTANVGIISYCLDTSKLQPTGTLNFSRIDTFRLVVPPTLTNGVKGLYATTLPSAYPTPYIYAVNYNILRIQNGLGSLLYAN